MIGERNLIQRLLTYFIIFSIAFSLVQEIQHLNSKPIGEPNGGPNSGEEKMNFQNESNVEIFRKVEVEE